MHKCNLKTRLRSGPGLGLYVDDIMFVPRSKFLRVTRHSNEGASQKYAMGLDWIGDLQNGDHG